MSQGELLPRFFRVTATWRAGIREGAMTKGVVRRRTRYLRGDGLATYVGSVILLPDLTSVTAKPCSEADYTRNTHGGY